jgi:hypothetical protein
LPFLFVINTITLNTKFSPDTSMFKSVFYSNDNTNLLFYDKKNVVYIGVIGIYEGGYLCKFGMSGDVFRRDYIDHRTTFGNQFKMILIEQTDNNTEVEKYFKKFIASKNLNIKLLFDKKIRTELFVTNENFSVEDAIDLMTKLVKKHPLETIKILDEKIQKLQNKIDDGKDIIIAQTEKERLKLERERERTRQNELSKEKMEIKMKFLDMKKTNNDSDKNKEDKKDKKKNENKNQNKNQNIDLYKQYLNECTEYDTKHTGTKDLYENFQIWFKNKNENKEIPNNREFVANIKKHKTVKYVKINKATHYGVQNLKLK